MNVFCGRTEVVKVGNVRLMGLGMGSVRVGRVIVLKEIVGLGMMGMVMAEVKKAA